MPVLRCSPLPGPATATPTARFARVARRRATSRPPLLPTGSLGLDFGDCLLAIANTKSQEVSRDVPLSKRALELLEALPHDIGGKYSQPPLMRLKRVSAVLLAVPGMPMRPIAKKPKRRHLRKCLLICIFMTCGMRLPADWQRSTIFVS